MKEKSISLLIFLTRVWYKCTIYLSETKAYRTIYKSDFLRFVRFAAHYNVTWSEAKEAIANFELSNDLMDQRSKLFKEKADRVFKRNSPNDQTKPRDFSVIDAELKETNERIKLLRLRCDHLTKESIQRFG